MSSKLLGVCVDWCIGASRGLRRRVLIAGWVACVSMSATSYGGLIDNFESYSTGLVSGGAIGGVWTSLAAAGNIDTGIIQDEGGNSLLSASAAGSQNSGVYRALPTAIPGSTAATTVFMRVRANGTGVNHSFGLSDVVAPTDANTFGVFEPQFRMINTAGANLRFEARNGGSFVSLGTPVTVGQWYNVWMVLSTATDTWDAYINTGLGDATVADLKLASIAFRDGTDSNTALSTFLVFGGGGGDLAGSIDDIYISDGVDLTNPVPEPTACIMVVTGLGLVFLQGRRSGSARRRAELN